MNILKVPQDKIKIGMVLAEDINEPAGKVILSKGEKVEEKHLRIFKIWGISEIKTEDSPEILEEYEAGYSEKEMKEAQDIADLYFSHTNKKDAIIKQLYQVFVERHLTGKGDDR